LVDRDEFDGVHLPQLREAEVERFFDVAFHGDAESVRIDGQWNGREVVTDKEGVVRRDDAFVEDGERCLELRRATGLEDERALAGELGELPLTVGEGERDDVVGEGPDAEDAGRTGEGATLEEMSAGVTETGDVVIVKD
jgi:hypothetical protein